MIQTSVSTKYQVVIPREIRKKIKVKPGQKMNVNISGEQIILSPAQTKKKLDWPHDHIKLLSKDWQGINVEKYLEEERNSWD